MELAGRGHGYVDDKILDRLFGIRGVLPINLWKLYGGERSIFTAFINEMSIYSKQKYKPPLLEIIGSQNKNSYILKKCPIDNRFNRLNYAKLNSFILGNFAYARVPCNMSTRKNIILNQYKL